MTSEGSPANVEALATRVKDLLWVVLDSVPAELVPWSVMVVRLLQAADTFPRGGMYDGHYGAQAALRYELFWLPLAARAQAARKPLLVPPLDVSIAWLLHRCTDPASYPTDCLAITGGTLDPPPAQAFRFAGSHSYTQCESLEERQAWASREAWDAAYVYGNGFPDIGIRSAGGGNPLLGCDGDNRGGSPATIVGGPPEAASGGSGGGGDGGKGSRWANMRRRSPTGSINGGSNNGRTDRVRATEAAVAEPAWTTVTAAPPARNVVDGGATDADLRAPYWPPAPPGSRGDLTRRWQPHPLVTSSAGGVDGGEGGGTSASSACGRLAGWLAPRMSELCPLLHSLLRPAYLDPDVLAQAVQRYCRFLMLQGMHPSVQMVPTTDIALMWVTHMAVPASYRDTCRRLLGRVVVPGPGVLRLQDGSAAFAETQRLYEHHFDEVYDPALTRAVPLATLHPLMSTPLAPFLEAYDIAAPPLLPSDGTNIDGAPAAGAIDEGLPYSVTTASRTEGGHRCGAHALYLAYLLRRGSNRSAKSLLGLVLGHGHRRRVAVRYVANKAAGFRDFLHLPHSDCHVYWSHLRLRRVDPDSVSASATPTPTQSGSQPDDTPASVQQLDDLERDLDGASDMEADINRGRRHRLRQRQAGETDREAREERARIGPQPQRREGVRRDLAQGLTAPPPLASTPAATIAGRRMLWVDPVGEISTPRRRSTSSSEGASLDSDSPPVLQAPGLGRGPGRGGGSIPSAWERPKRIALIVPLPAEPHTTFTVTAAGHEAVNKWLSGPGTNLASGRKEQSSTLAPPYDLSDGSYSKEISQHGMMTVDGHGQPTAATVVALKGAGGGTLCESDPMTIQLMPKPMAAAGPPPSAASSEDSLAELVPSVEIPAAGLSAKAAATQEPQVAWAAPRAEVEREQQKQPQQQQQPTLPDQPQQTWYGPAAAVQDGEPPLSPLSPPPFVRRKNADGTEEWAYNNPHFVERSSQMGPLSPTGPTPPPASAAYLAAAAGAEAPSGYNAAAAQGSEASAQVQGPVEAGDAIQAFSAPIAATDPISFTATAAGAFTAAAINASTAKDVEDVTEPRGLAQLRTSGRMYDSGPPSAGGSVYLSCAGSRASLAEMAPDSADADSNSSDGGKSMYGTPSANLTASVITPFTVAPAAAAQVSDTIFKAASNTDSSAASTAAATVTVAAAVGGGSRCGATRFSGPSPSRLARVTSATGETAMPAPSLPPGTAASTASATSAASGTALHTSGGSLIGPNRSVSGIPRPQSGLPPRPILAPTAAPAGAAATVTSAAGNGGVTRRAGGGYSMSDISYMTGLGGGLASLVTGGDESPFSMSLRERYGSSSRGPSGGGSSSSAGGGGGSLGPVAAASRDSSGRSGGSLDSVPPGSGGGADRGHRKGSGSSGGSAPMATKGNSGDGVASRASKGSGGRGLSTTGLGGWRR